MKLAVNLKKIFFRAFAGALAFLILPLLFNAFSRIGFSLMERHSLKGGEDGAGKLVVKSPSGSHGKTVWDAFAAACAGCS